MLVAQIQRVPTLLPKASVPWPQYLRLVQRIACCFRSIAAEQEVAAAVAHQERMEAAGGYEVQQERCIVMILNCLSC